MGGQAHVNGQYTTNGSPITDNVVATGIQSLDLEAAPSPNDISGSTPLPGIINITVDPLNGSGLQTLYIDMLNSSSSGHLINPVLVTVNGYGNHNATFLGAAATISTLAGGTQGAPPNAQVYAITSTNTAGNLTILTTDQLNDQLIYNAGNGNNSMGLQNTAANPGAIVFNSAASSLGTDTVNILQSVGAVTINQNGKDQIVNVGSSATGALPAIKSPVLLAGAVPYVLSPTGYLGSLALNVSDAGDTTARMGSITSGVISGLGLGGNTISYTYASSVNVILGFGDLITAGAGSDSINEGLVSVGGGINTITAGDGNDTVTTGVGRDLITLGNGADLVNLGNGNATLVAGNGNDSVTTATGSDSITVGNGTDTIAAGDGSNTITAGSGNDLISAGDGGNRITTGGGMSTIATGSGNDVILVGLGNNSISSGAGDDIVDIGTGASTIMGVESPILPVTPAGRVSHSMHPAI